MTTINTTYEVTQTVVRGASIRDPVVILFQDAERTIPVDLTGVTATLILRSHCDTIIYDASGSIVITPLLGKIVFEIPDTVTELLLLGKRYHYSLKLTYPSGAEATVLKSKLTVVVE
jgi:hypothetical protein